MYPPAARAGAQGGYWQVRFHGAGEGGLRWPGPPPHPSWPPAHFLTPCPGVYTHTHTHTHIYIYARDKPGYSKCLTGPSGGPNCKRRASNNILITRAGSRKSTLTVKTLQPQSYKLSNLRKGTQRVTPGLMHSWTRTGTCRPSLPETCLSRDT